MDKTISTMDRRQATSWKSYSPSDGQERTKRIYVHTQKLSNRRVTNFSKALMLLKCVLCKEKLVNSKLRLSILIQHDSHIVVKHWAFNILPALIIHVYTALWYMYHLYSFVHFICWFSPVFNCLLWLSLVDTILKNRSLTNLFHLFVYL